MEYLILLSIGPVQEFIASARRSRDLWFSSWLLSELAKTAARTLRDDCPGTILIFPNPPTAEFLAKESDWNVTNNIVARIQQAPKVVGDKVEEALRQRLSELWQRAFQRIVKPGETLLDIGLAEQQIADLFECQWVAIPLTEPYDQVRRQALALLAARKATRDFGAVPWDTLPGIPKSSLDGKRESVIREDMFDKLKPRELYQRVRARKAERLSAVDLLKRLGLTRTTTATDQDLQEHFPSTSHMAALPFMVRLEKEAGRATPLFKDLLAELDELGYQPERVRGGYYVPALFKTYDGSLFFESRIREAPEEFNLSDDRVDAAAQALRHFIGQAGRGAQPSPYYALLVADGDRMGAAIDAQTTVEKHQAISRCLSEFAGEARKIVQEDHQGALIYAGGDDVMAFLPLHSAFDCTYALANAFAEKMKDYADHEGKTPKLSAGLAICHHIEPLSDALAAAMGAEKAAKKVKGKNALAITLAKRSGADRTVAGVWTSIYPRLRVLINAHRRAEIPDGAAYQLRDLHNRLASSEKDAATLQRAMRAEASRILERKRGKRGREKVPEDFHKAVARWLEGHKEPSGDPLVYELSLAQLADELIIAAELAKAEELALWPIKDPLPAPGVTTGIVGSQHTA